MNWRDFDNKQLEMQMKDLKRCIEIQAERPLTVREKDWFNLRYDRGSIRCGSRSYRSGLISSLDRAIKRLEKEMTSDKLRRVKGEWRCLNY